MSELGYEVLARESIERLIGELETLRKDAMEGFRLRGELQAENDRLTRLVDFLRGQWIQAAYERDSVGEPWRKVSSDAIARKIHWEIEEWEAKQEKGENGG